MTKDVLDRLILSRHLLSLASQCITSGSRADLFSGVNLLQDAVEAFLLALADHLQIAVKSKNSFDGYFAEIDKSIAPQKLPFQPQLMRLNKMRVNSKHYGVEPPRDECASSLLIANEFFATVSIDHIAVDFFLVSSIDLLADNEVKSFLQEAKDSLENADYCNCLIACRKALFLAFEKDYDIYPYGQEDLEKNFLKPYTRAPFYARQKTYIDEFVKEPTEFVVYDHDDVERQILTYGIVPHQYWNVWRLTPNVYRFNTGRWVVRNDLTKTATKNIAENARYVFNAMTEILLSIQNHNRQSIYTNELPYHALLQNYPINVYIKADELSTIAATISADLGKIICIHNTTGMSNDDLFWLVGHAEPGKLIFGYIHNRHVKSIHRVGEIKDAESGT